MDHRRVVRQLEADVFFSHNEPGAAFERRLTMTNGIRGQTLLSILILSKNSRVGRS